MPQRDRAEELRHAAGSGDGVEVERLLNLGTDPNAFDEAGLGALQLAAQGEHYEIVHLLLARGAEVDAQDARTNGSTPLGEVAGTCSLRMAKLLVDAGANPTLRGWMQLRALDHSRRRQRGEGPQVHELLVRAAQRWAAGVK